MTRIIMKNDENKKIWTKKLFELNRHFLSHCAKKYPNLGFLIVLPCPRKPRQVGVAILLSCDISNVFAKKHCQCNSTL
jgi:hypothetical protein